MKKGKESKTWEWWFFKYRGRWWNEEDLQTEHGLAGLEESECSARLVLETDCSDIKTWKDVAVLLTTVLALKSSVLQSLVLKLVYALDVNNIEEARRITNKLYMLVIERRPVKE